MEHNTIQLVKKPEISHKLQEIGASVTFRLSELNVNNLVATEETVKHLKDLRAELNKELDGYEEQRKLVKTGILNPYNEFETLYKTEIADRYTSAITTLKDKIASVETKIKDEKKLRIELYFNELCMSEKIEFLKFANLNLDINLSTSEKAYKEKVNEFIKRVTDDLALIKTTEYEAEILTDYKKTLNASLSITSIKKRKEEEEAEKQRLLQIEINNRISKVKSIGLIYDQFTKSYVLNDSIFITEEFLKTSNAKDFSNKIIEIEEKIVILNREKVAIEKDKTEKVTSENIDLFNQTQKKEEKESIITTPVISAPIVEVVPKTDEVIASFEVRGSMAQLKALGQYMRDNKIQYTNI